MSWLHTLDLPFTKNSVHNSSSSTRPAMGGWETHRIYLAGLRWTAVKKLSWQWHTTVNCNVILYVGFLGTISTQLERWCNLLAASFCYTEYMLLDVCVYHQTTYYFCCCWWMSLLLSLRSSFRITSKNWTRRLIVHNATEDHRIFL